jgi:hypothetical protein
MKPSTHTRLYRQRNHLSSGLWRPSSPLSTPVERAGAAWFGANRCSPNFSCLLHHGIRESDECGVGVGDVHDLQEMLPADSVEEGVRRSASAGQAGPRSRRRSRWRPGPAAFVHRLPSGWAPVLIDDRVVCGRMYAYTQEVPL